MSANTRVSTAVATVRTSQRYDSHTADSPAISYLLATRNRSTAMLSIICKEKEEDKEENKEEDRHFYCAIARKEVLR